VKRRPQPALPGPLLLPALAALLLLAGTPAGATVIPDPGRCPALRGAPTAAGGDAGAQPLAESSAVGIQDLLLIRELLPAEVWRHRDVFFYEGMRLEIGPCFRHYPASASYEEATRKFAGRARVDAQGNLRDHVAGLPFPPETIDPKAPDGGPGTRSSATAGPDRSAASACSTCRAGSARR